MSKIRSFSDYFPKSITFSLKGFSTSIASCGPTGVFGMRFMVGTPRPLNPFPLWVVVMECTLDIKMQFFREANLGSQRIRTVLHSSDGNNIPVHLDMNFRRSHCCGGALKAFLPQIYVCLPCHLQWSRARKSRPNHLLAKRKIRPITVKPTWLSTELD